MDDATELAEIKASMAYRHSLIGRETARADKAEQQTEAMRAHFAKMQDMARRYLEPGSYYVDRDGVDSSNRDPLHSFLGDIVYMLDGPEQRAAFPDDAAPADPNDEDPRLVELRKASWERVVAFDDAAAICTDIHDNTEFSKSITDDQRKWFQSGANACRAMSQAKASYISRDLPWSPTAPNAEWVMVPREPTEAMLKAAGRDPLSIGACNLDRDWTAMLAAAPAPPPLDPATVEACAKVAEAHKPPRAKLLSAYDPEDREMIRTEENGEKIAASCIAAAIRALTDHPVARAAVLGEGAIDMDDPA